MRIAICDDVRKVAELFYQKVHNIEPDSEISIFTNGKDLIESDELWDVIFLDIEMDVMNGFEIAEILNRKQPMCILAFITTHAELAIDGYDYQPFRYILKSSPNPVVERKIWETINEYYRRNKTLTVSYKKTHRTILVSDIVYIEIKGHCMNIILEDEVIFWNKSLNDIEKDLDGSNLVRCHRSFMMSLHQIAEFTLKNIRMKNGDIVPVGRSYRKHIMESYRHFTVLN